MSLVSSQAHQTPAKLSVAPEPFEAVRELRTLVALVRELSDEQRERLRVARDPQGSSVDRIEPYVADQLSGSLFGELISTLLLTGGRETEVLGVEVDDVSLDRGVVTFRPNEWRRLKTASSHRSVPLWPQLRDAL